MSAAPAPSSLNRALRRRPTPRSERPTTGPGLIVRLQPPSADPGWVIELLTLVERWLESAPLPCASLLYGGRSYLIRSSTQLRQTIISAGDMLRAGSDE